MRRVLVTGGAGYIGAHTCKALAEAGFEPMSYDNLSMGHRHNVRWGPLIVGDVGDRALLSATLGKYRPEAVLHFAGNGYVGESFQAPGKYYRNNTANMLVLLETMQASGVDRIVFSSSCATYGLPLAVPIPVDHPQNPINPYGRSKLFAERIIQDCGRAFGLRYCILRYFNAAGADPSRELREQHNPEYHLIPVAVNAALGRGPAVEIFGTDYPTPDGTCIRDYVHVTDLAHAHVRALMELENGAMAIVRNLGTGKGASVREVVQTIEKLTGRAMPQIARPRRPGDPPELVADADASQLRYCTIEEIIATVL